MLYFSRVALLAGGDVLSLLLFTAIGRFSHGFSVFDADTLRTADPFVAGTLTFVTIELENKLFWNFYFILFFELGKIKQTLHVVEQGGFWVLISLEVLGRMVVG